jgi:hypothetical protein
MLYGLPWIVKRSFKSLQGVSIGTKRLPIEENKIIYKLIRMALVDVEEKKRIYEKGLGVALVPMGFSETMGLQPPVRALRREKKMDAAISSIVSSAPEIQASFGESRYSIHLNVEYIVNKFKAKK